MFLKYFPSDCGDFYLFGVCFCYVCSISGLKIYYLFFGCSKRATCVAFFKIFILFLSFFLSFLFFFFSLIIWVPHHSGCNKFQWQTLSLSLSNFSFFSLQCFLTLQNPSPSSSPVSERQKHLVVDAATDERHRRRRLATKHNTNYTTRQIKFPPERHSKKTTSLAFSIRQTRHRLAFVAFSSLSGLLNLSLSLPLSPSPRFITDYERSTVL